MLTRSFKRPLATLTITIDPLSAHDAEASLIQACGLLPEMAMNLDFHSPVPESAGLEASLEAHYHFASLKKNPLPSAEILPNGQMTYPGDPPSNPLMKIERQPHGESPPETLYIYPHAFVGIIRPDGSQAVTRMD